MGIGANKHDLKKLAMLRDYEFWPEFSPGCREFLVIDLYGAVQRFSYPVVELLGVCASPFGDDEPFRLSLCYLDNACALAVSLNGRIAVLDTPTMRVVNELTIEGHPAPLRNTIRT